MPAGEKTFYAVHVPGSLEGVKFVFLTLREARSCAQKFHKWGARFKAFDDEEAAHLFCASGKEPSDSKSRCSNGGEPTTCYNKPTPSEINSLREDIEKFHFKSFVEKALNNPRLLISLESDSPAILHMGCRYNALHLAARCGNYDVCEFILALLDDCEYVKRLFPRCSSESAESNRLFVLASYLNTPDRIMNATPLYLAAKFGHVRIVRLLTSYRECDKSRLSRQGLLAADVVCESNPNGSYLVRRDIKLYVWPKCYYVPLYREGKSRDSEDFILQPPYHELPVTSYRVNSDIPTEFFLAACAGPFAEEGKAQRFYKSWKNLATYSMKPKKDHVGLYATDSFRDMERLGRKLASLMVCPWSEYWNFLKAFCDIRTDKGLAKFDRFLQRRHVLLCHLKNVSEELPVDEPPTSANIDNVVEQPVAPLSNVVLREQAVYGTPPESLFEIPFREVGGVEEFCASSESASLPFIHGEVPLKTDCDVFEAISHNKNLTDYPFVNRWFKYTSSYTETEMAKWPPVGSPRERTMRFKSTSNKIKRRLFNNLH